MYQVFRVRQPFRRPAGTWVTISPKPPSPTDVKCEQKGEEKRQTERQTKIRAHRHKDRHTLLVG